MSLGGILLMMISASVSVEVTEQSCFFSNNIKAALNRWDPSSKLHLFEN